jgi:hypothetical protein
VIVLILTASPPSSRRRQHVNSQLNPEDPALKALVIEIVNSRLDEVLARIRARLEGAGYSDAARYVTRNSGD